MYPAATEASFETKYLERLRLAVISRLSKEFFHGIEVGDVDASAVLGMQTNDIVQRIEALVWSDPSQSHKKTHEIRVDDAHPSWRHALVAGLPKGTFRHRFMAYFLDVPLEYETTTVTHKVEVNVPAVLPEVQRQFPPDMGRVMYPISMHAYR